MSPYGDTSAGLVYLGGLTASPMLSVRYDPPTAPVRQFVDDATPIPPAIREAGDAFSGWRPLA